VRVVAWDSVSGVRGFGGVRVKLCVVGVLWVSCHVGACWGCILGGVCAKLRVGVVCRVMSRVVVSCRVVGVKFWGCLCEVVYFVRVVCAVSCWSVSWV